MSDSSKKKRRVLQTKLTGGNLFSKKPKSEEYVVCPICDIEINSTLIHLHIDSCLLKSAESKDNDPVAIAFTEENEIPAAQVKITESHVEVERTCPDPLPNLPPDLRLVEVAEVPGLWLIHNFITEAEEEEIVSLLDEDSTPWHFSSFNGNCNSKSFGVKTQFGTPGEERCVRRNNPAIGEHDIPAYLHTYPLRLQRVVEEELAISHRSESIHSLGLSYHRKNVPPPEVVKFIPNECNANSYEAKCKHYLRAHFDDRILSGPILMNLSLNCDSRMTYHMAVRNGSDVETPVYLPRRTLQLVTGPARWKYRHSIKADDVIGERRVSVTWRRSESKITGIRNQSHSEQDARVLNSKSL